MKQPWWRNFFSYFREIELERVSTVLNPLLVVSYSRGSYQLSTEKAIYSFSEKYDNFFDTFAQMDISKFRGKSVLILGFGLGSIPVILEKDPEFNASFTAVELDEAVIGLYQKYVADEIRSPMEIIIADAYNFLLQNHRKFDLIAMDVFEGDLIPNKFLSEEFCIWLKNSLSEEGVLIWNHLYHYDYDRISTDRFFKNTFVEVFPEAYALQTRGNKMMLNKNVLISDKN